MQFELNEDQALLRNSTREMLEKEAPLTETRGIMEDSAEGFARDRFGELGELGYLGMLLSEDRGGLGPIAFAVVMSELGRVAFPGPLLDLSLAVRVLSECSGEVAAEWQSKAAAGEALVVLAVDEDLNSTDPAVPGARFANGRVSGAKVFVPFGRDADALVVSTQEGLVLATRPDAGWNAEPLETLDHAQRFVRIELEHAASLVADAALAERLLEDARRLGALGASAQLVGLMERSLELAVGYTSEREAFGVPIGSFQALQHRCADMLIQTESARSASFRAAWAEEHAPAEAEYLVSVAKAWAGPAARFVCGQTIQLHGGVGYTWEYDPQIYLKRTKTLEQFYGSTDWHVENALVHAPVMEG